MMIVFAALGAKATIKPAIEYGFRADSPNTTTVINCETWVSVDCPGGNNICTYTFSWPNTATKNVYLYNSDVMPYTCVLAARE